ncbi:MAG: IclR family transcriptional regulator C-terminal domain-containing protein [Acidimicrobiia bacterium]
MVTVSHVGKQIPANCTAMGKVLLARLVDTEMEARFDGTYPTLTPGSLGSYTSLVADLAEIRTRGFALDLGETLVRRACLAISLDSSLAIAPDGVDVGISMAMHRYERDGEELLRSLMNAGKRLDNEGEQRMVMTGSSSEARQ